MVKFIIIALVGVIVYLGVTKLLSSAKSNPYTVKHRVRNLSKMNDLSDFSNKKKKEAKGLFSFITVSQGFRAYIMSSGIKLKPEEFVVFWFISIAFPTVLMFTIKGISLWVIFGAIVGAFAPALWIKISRKKRIHKFNMQLNDALIIIGNSLRSGFTFRHALARVAEDLPDPISEEFRRVIREVNYGGNIEQSLGQLALKMESRELEIINSAVIIQQRSGGNLADIIEKVGETISDRIQMRNKIRALTAQGRMSGWVIALIPVVIVLFISFANPEYMSVFYTNPIGMGAMTIAIVLEITGLVIINKMVNVKY